MRHTERQSPIVCSTLCCIQMADLLKMHIFFSTRRFFNRCKSCCTFKKMGYTNIYFAQTAVYGLHLVLEVEFTCF